MLNLGMDPLANSSGRKAVGQACPPGRYAPEAATPQCQADIDADVQ